MIKQSSKSVQLRLRVTKPWLGARRNKNVRRFDIDKIGGKDHLVLDLVMWRWALREAMDAEGLLAESDVDYVSMPTHVPAPKIRLYQRVWDPKNPSGREMFESIQAGTVLTIPIVILSSLPSSGPFEDALNLRPPTEEEVKRCFSVIGTSIGLSPFGSRFGYGRFIVEDKT